MSDIRAAKHVFPYYPEAVSSSVFVQAFLWFVRHTLGVSEKQVAFLTSVCSDDLNSVELPDTKMVGPFVLGGLDGYPFVGKTGLGAFSHHVPVKGAAMMFFGPHVGITDKGEVGRVVRPGQSHASDCCGAAMAGLKKLEAGGITHKPHCDFAQDDYQQETLEQLLLAHGKEILDAGSPGDPKRFVKMSEVLYGEMKQSLLKLLGKVKFEAPLFVYGGILINEDGGKGSSIALRDALYFHEGKVEDVTPKFRQGTQEKFKDFQSGKLDAFK